MSKNIVSGAVALMMVVLPASASALSQSDVYLPTIPQNATVQDLLNIVAQLQAILTMLLSHDQPVIEEPLNCPVYNAPLCAPNEHLVAGEYQPNGCQAAPRCVANSPADASTASVSFLGITGAIYRIGTTVDWTVNYLNAPSDSNICLVIQSITSAWEGGFQGFGGSDGCYYASGNGSRTFHAVLAPKPGFDFRAGQYRLVAKLIKAATGNYSPYAVANSGTFTVLPTYEDAPTIKLTGPANGSVYKVGDTIPVTYNFTDAPANAQIIIKTENIQTSNPPSGAVSAGQWQSPMLVQGSGNGTYTWQTGPSMTDLTGIYRITAWMRECDPRGCSWNADFPGSPYPVRTLASAPNNVTITLNSALTGSPAGSASVTVINSPAPQTLTSGQEALVANYSIIAEKEDVRITVANLAYTDNIAIDPVNCALYDGNTKVSSVSNASYGSGDYTFTLGSGVVVSKTSPKILGLRCYIPVNSTPGSFAWGLRAGSYWAGQGVQSGAEVKVSAWQNPGPLMTVGNTPTRNPRLLFGAVAQNTVSFDYIDMPANTQIILVNQTTGARVDVTGSTMIPYGGSGSLAMTLNGVPAGLYYIKAQDYSTQAYIAQTIAFTYGGTPSAQPTITVTNKIRPFIRFHIDNVPPGIQGVYLTGESTNTNVAYTNIISSSGDGTIVMNDVSPNGMYHLRLLAVVNNEVLAKSGSFYITSNTPSVCPVYNIMQCPAGQHMVNDGSTYDANQCEIPHMRCVPDTLEKCIAPTITQPNASYSLALSPNQNGTGQQFTADQSVTYSLVNSPSWATFNGSVLTFNNVPTSETLYTFNIVATNSCGMTGTRALPVYVRSGSGTFDTSTLTTTSKQPTITGTATESAVGISISNSGGKVYGSGLIGNNGGHWSHVVTTSLAAGSYVIDLYNYYSNVKLATATLTVQGDTTPPTADIKANGSNGPITVPYGASVTLSWTSSNVSSCGIAPSGPTGWAGNWGTANSKDTGPLTQSINYTLQCNGNNGLIVSDVVLVSVQPAIPSAQVTCTYTPGASKYGDKYVPPSQGSAPSTINIEGGQAACSAWCSSQAAEQNVYYTCAYNGAQITMVNRNAQLASALTAVQDAVKWLIAFFKKSESPEAGATVGTSSAPQKWGPTASTNTQPAAAPTGTLHAVYKGTAIPDVMNVTQDIAQKLCRPDATCTWNGEPIVSAGYAPIPGGDTITFTLPAPASKQSLTSGAGYTFEISDTSSLSGVVNADSYRLYFAKYTSKDGPDVIYQAKLSSVARTLSGAVQLKWDGMIINPDGSTVKLPAGFYYAGAVNAKNALKGGSTGSVTITQ